MTRAEAVSYLGEMHVRHAVLDVERSRIDAELKQLEKRIEDTTRALIHHRPDPAPAFDTSDVKEESP